MGSLVLAAGTLNSARIFSNRCTGRAARFRSARHHGQSPGADAICKPADDRQALGPRVYQYHQVAMAVQLPKTGELIHGLVTTLKTALIHPLVQTLPFDLGTGVSVFRSLHGALGMVNINFPDQRRERQLSDAGYLLQTAPSGDSLPAAERGTGTAARSDRCFPQNTG